MRRRTEDDLKLRQALRALPVCEPPASAWDAIEARVTSASGAAPVRRQTALNEPRSTATIPAADATPEFPQWRVRVRAMSWAGIAAAAAVAAMTVALVLRPEPQQRTPGAAAPALASAAALDALVAESARLERTLVSLPRFDGVVRVGTASTIAGLEDHIAWIDAELSAGAALDTDLIYREALWRERVDVMNALIDVQYAQLPATVLLQ